MNKILSLLFAMIVSAPLVSQNDVAWSSSASISSSGVNASAPQVGIDPNGNVAAAWIENGNVITKLNIGGTWGTSTALTSSGLASAPRLVVDSSGNITAVWIDNGIIYAAIHPHGGSWGAHTSLSLLSTASSPAIAVDSSGNVVVVWIGGGAIESSTHMSGGSWPLLASTLALSGDSPQVAIGNNGTVVAVWHRPVALGITIDSILAATKSISGTWSTGQVISSTSYSSVYPQVAVDINGNAIAGWYRYALSGTLYSNVAFQSASLPVGGSWSTPTDLSLVGMKNPANLAAKLHFDSFGNAIALWLNSYDGISYIAQSAIKPSGQSWTSSVDALQDVYCYSVDLCGNPLGDTFFISMGSIVSGFINALALNINTTADTKNVWSDLQYVANYPNNGFGKIASSVNGTNNLVAAAWINYNGINNNIQVATGTNPIIQPPTGLSVTQSINNFGIFNEYYNELSWTPSSDPGVAAYFIYRNNILISTINASLSEYIDHNRNPAETDVYGVSAVYSTGFQSTKAFVTYP